MLYLTLNVTKMLAQMLLDQQKLRDQKLILKQLDALASQLKTLDAKLDERTLRDARTAAQHLQRGLSSDVADVQAEEFRQARSKFAELIDLDVNGITAGTSGEMRNPSLICLGYWGSFHYFLLNNDFRNAAIQVYEATIRCPDQALLTFAECHPTFYSQDYHALMAEPLAQFYAVQQELLQIRNQNRHDKIEGAVIGGTIAAVTVLTGGIGGLIAGALGVGHVSELMHSKDTSVQEQELSRLRDLLDTQRAALVAEAEHRKSYVENLKPSQMQPRAPRSRKPKAAQMESE